MSLDVYLTMKDAQVTHDGPRIFIREDGQVKEITRAEWDERFPDREPFTVESFTLDVDSNDKVYHDNITHNLGVMAWEAGIHEHLWNPDEIGITKAKQLIQPLHRGLALLKSDPDRFRKFNPSNGWGNYEGLVEFVENYLKACKEYPDAEVSVSR